MPVFGLALTAVFERRGGPESRHCFYVSIVISVFISCREAEKCMGTVERSFRKPALPAGGHWCSTVAISPAIVLFICVVVFSNLFLVFTYS